MFYTLYKTTCLVSGIFYIGVHKTDNLEDGYIGSGKAFKTAVKKYGKENFEKVILYLCESEDEMYELEELIVDKSFVSNRENYNLIPGGFSAYDSLNELMKDETWKSRWLKRHSDSKKELYKNSKHPRLGFKASEKTKEKQSSSLKKFYSENENPFLGKNHSEESKKKIGEANSKHQLGESNSQFGTMWIYNLEEKLSKKIKKEELPEYENLGWSKGRKIKF